MIVEEKSYIPDWGIIFKWGLVTAIGLIISDGIQAYFIRPNSLLSFFIPGITIGVLQWWYFLRNKINNAGIWVWVTFLGWALSWFSGGLAGSVTNLLLALINGTITEGDVINAGSSPLGLPVQIIVHGIMLGIIQWFFFMRKKFKMAAWWIPASTLGWSVSILIGWLIIPAMAQIIGWNESGLEDSAIRGVIFGLITGIAINWLMEQPLPDTKNLGIDVGSIP